MKMIDHVYLSLGSNVGNSLKQIKTAFLEIANISHLYQLRTSRLYRTSPVSPIPQRDYINGVCRFQTTLSACDLFEELRKIEKKLGKENKAKEEPRSIDIDILFFGKEFIHENYLQIPHPRWKERLFVLIPLLDLTETITYPIGKNEIETLSIKDYIQTFPNKNEQRVSSLNTL
jgi:2-amino-4-hydroxy-6-hydroxymethyldihydropteridine diphosphokinase